MLGGLVSRRGAFGKRQHAEDAEENVIVGDACIGQRIVRIKGDGTVIFAHRFGKAFFSEAVPVITPAQVSFKRLRVLGAALGKLLLFFAGQLRNQCAGDLFGDRIFKPQHIDQFFVELSCPTYRAFADLQ